MLSDFIHKLFNPHCEHCTHEAELKYEREKEAKYCHSCDTLKQLLDTEIREKERLLQIIIDRNTEKVEPKIDTREMKPLGRPYIPHRVRTQMLEAEDRAKAEVLNKLEKEVLEVGVSDASKVS